MEREVHQCCDAAHEKGGQYTGKGDVSEQHTGVVKAIDHVRTSTAQPIRLVDRPAEMQF